MSEEQKITTQEAPISQPTRTYNPFFENVNEKPYTNLSVGVSQEQMTNAIPEPTFQPHSIDTGENPYDMLGGDAAPSGGGGGAKSTPPPINPMMNDLSDAEKKMGAEHMANLILDGYEQLHVFGNQLLQFPERKLRKLQSEGEIDLGIEIPYEYGKTITAGEFIQEFNEQNKDTLSVSKEFKKDVKPPLIRVLQKRGAGMTDEQYLLFAFGKDLAVKGVIIAQMRGTMNDMINIIKDHTLAFKESGMSRPTSTQPNPTQPTTTPSPTQQVYHDQTINTNAADFNFQTNESVMNSSVQQMQVPSTGKARVIQQLAKEKKWKKDAEGTPSAYELAMKNRTNNGKRGRKAKSDSIPLDEEEIAEAIILNETINQPKKEKDPYADLD
jgi:hypothetical protein